MKRREMARLGAVLFVAGVAAVVAVVVLPNSWSATLVLLAPLSLLGAAGFFLLIFAWVTPPEKNQPVV
jgi:hypothetical protein